MKESESNYFVGGILIGLLILFSYIVANNYIETQKKGFEDTLESATQNSSINTINQIMTIIVTQAITCNPVTIPYQNQTYELIWKECLNDN